VSQEVKNEVASLAGFVATPILVLAKQVDPYCGGALAEAFPDVLDLTLPLICRSSRIVKLVTEEAEGWVLAGKLAMVLAPLGKAVAEHHIFKTVEVVKD